MGKFWSDIRLRVRTPIGCIFVLGGVAQWIFDRYEEGQTMIEHLPPVINLLSRPFSGFLLILIGAVFIWWEVHDIGKEKGEPAKRRLTHYLRDAVICSAGVIVVLSFLGAISYEVIKWKFPESLKKNATVQTYESAKNILFEVYPPFQVAHEEYKSMLGDAIAAAMINPNGNGGSQDEFEHAVILFLDKLYVLYDDGHSMEKTEGGYPPQNYFDPVWLRKTFEPPPGFGPPRGSAAEEWEKKSSEWKKNVGYTKWYCDFASLDYQKFEHGKILGVFVALPIPAKEQQRGLLYVLFDNRTWKSVLADVKDTPSNSTATCHNFTPFKY
jgi:hypothetical protein